jgi:cytochrome c oxidase subunit 4
MSEHDHDNHAHGEHAEEEHHGGFSTYFSVFIALLVLTGMSFFVGSSSMFAQTPLIRNSFMIMVSCAKALLVMLFFMHLKWEANWKYVLTIPASLMSMFLVLMLWPDVGSRMRTYAEERWYRASLVESHDAGHGDDHGKSGDHQHDAKKH